MAIELGSLLWLWVRRISCTFTYGRSPSARFFCLHVLVLMFFKVIKTNLAESALGNVSVLIFDANFVDYTISAGGDGKMDEKT